MSLFFGSMWHAWAGSFHIKMIGLSLLPLVLMVVMTLGGGYFLWEPAQAVLREWMSQMPEPWLMEYLNPWFLQALQHLFIPTLIIVLITPVLVIFALLIVSWFATHWVVQHVSFQKFSTLEKKQGASWFHSIFWSVVCTLIAVLFLFISLPLWLIPVFAFLIPAFIIGWLTYRIIFYDCLSTHASREERKLLFQQHRYPCLLIGIISSAMGVIPGLLLSSSSMLAALFLVFVPFAVWLYTWIMIFTVLWFAHYALTALHRLRSEGVACPSDTVIDI
ncbi:MAG: EI24 domain-containing protein [Limnohabitans sp.]|nr:EI24 domain-containing protein [Limnohabitans sp.]